MKAQPLEGAAMLVLNLVFLTLLASSAAQSGLTGYFKDQWIIRSDNPHYGDTDEQSLAVEGIWPDSPPAVVEVVTPADQHLSTPEPYAAQERDLDSVEDSSVWKVLVVVAVLLVSLVGSMSMAYYYCVWRGGRIHYQPQKEGYA